MKKGISLIVLVITIIVMIILAASVVITLSNTSVINRASEAVDATNEKQVQDLAALIWADAFMDNKRDDSLRQYVVEELEKQGITSDKWNISVNNSGATITSKYSNEPGLGTLITAADYGKTVDYVSDNGITDWKIFYHTNDYVYLIASNSVKEGQYDSRFATASNGDMGVWYGSDWVYAAWEGTYPTNVANIQRPTLWMANLGAYSASNEGKCVSYFLDETYWTGAKNSTAKYKDYVVGAIGTPTVEMFVASWNAKGIAKNDATSYPQISLTKQDYGYIISGDTSQVRDAVYHADQETWLAGVIYSNNPCGRIAFMRSIRNEYGPGAALQYDCPATHDYARAFRPVVCLKASIPATVGTTTDFSLVK